MTSFERFFLLIFCFNLSFLSLLTAQKGDSLFNLAIQEAGERKFDSAVEHCLQGAESLAQEGKLEDWVAAKTFAARCAMSSPSYSMIEARQILDNAVETAPFEESDFRMGRLQLYYGWFLANRLSDYFNAKTAYEKTRNIIKHYESIESKDFVTQTPGKDVYKPLAQIYIQLGENEKATALMALTVEQLRKNGQVYDIPELFADWGILYHDLGENQNAAAQYQKGLDELESAFGGKELGPDDLDYYQNTKGLLLGSQAQSFRELGKINEAKSICEKALELLSWEDYRSGALSVMGHIVEEEEGKMAAVPFFKDAISFAELYFPPYSRRIAKIENELARIYREQGVYEQALAYTQKALSRIIPNVAPEDWNSLPAPDAFYPENAIMEVLTEKGTIFRSWYQSSGDLEKLQKAQEHFDLAIQMEEVLNNNYTYQSSMMTLVEQSHARHEAMMEILFELYHKSGDEKIIEKAFFYAEKSRAVILNRALTNSRAIQFSGDTSLFAREKALQAQLTDYQRLLFELRMEGADTHQIASVNREIYNLKEQYDHLLSEFEKKNARYYQLRHSLQLANLSQLRSKLDKGSLFVEYFLGQQNKNLYILAVSKNGTPRFYKQGLADNFDDELNEFLRRLKDWNFILNKEGDPQVFEDFVENAHQYYQLLLPEELNPTSFDRIILVPDGQLNLMPFDILLTNTENTPIDYAGLNYLLKETAINYAFSATIMLQDNKGRRKGRIKNYLGIAPDYSNSSDALSPVANNQEAVEAYLKMLKGKALIAENASIETFLNEAERYRILHFYGHAKSYPDHPMSSWMAFTSTAKPPVAQTQKVDKVPVSGLLGGPEDLPRGDWESLLFLFELYGMDLQADLAVLSACETGSGKIALGEGVISLARAFRYAGCPSTLMSLWEANDFQGEVAYLMEEFFKRIKEGELDKDEAIRQAKLAYLEDPKKSAYPSYWASFVLIGDHQPIDLNNSGKLWWMYPILLISIILGAALRRIRKRRINL